MFLFHVLEVLCVLLLCKPFFCANVDNSLFDQRGQLCSCAKSLTLEKKTLIQYIIMLSSVICSDGYMVGLGVFTVSVCQIPSQSDYE